MERVGNSRVEAYERVVRYLKGPLIKKFREVEPYCYIIVIHQMLHENGMKFSYFSGESLSNPPANKRQFARAIEYSITIHFGTVPSTRLNIDSDLSRTIK